MVTAAAARVDFGANFVRTIATKAVTHQLVDKVMDIAVIAKASTGEKFVTRHAAKVVHQIVIKAMEIVTVALLAYGELLVTKPAWTSVPRQAVLNQMASVIVASPGSGVYCATKHVAKIVLF
jgi:hypothetical protein